MYVDIHLDAEDLKLTLSGVCNGFIDHQRPLKLKRPYIPPTQFTHAPRRMGRNPRRRNAARPATCGKDDSPGDDVPHAVYHGCTFNVVNSDPVLAGELVALKAELEQARQEKAALQVELENTKAELEKVRQGEGQCLEWYGLIAVVEQSRKEGKTPQETAACLKGAGASWAVIGGLMHPQGDIKDWQQYGKGLFNGSTKTLPW